MGGTFVVTLREGFEAALILGIVYTYLQKIGAARHYHYATRGGLLGVVASVALGVLVTALTGAVLGLATAAALGWAIFRGGRHMSLQRFFAVTSILLLLLAAGMFSTGVGRLEAMGFLPQSPTVWDTSSALDDHAFVGGFLNGLVGYRARPSLLEAGSYLVYLIVSRSLPFRGGASKPRPRSPRRPIPAQVT